MPCVAGVIHVCLALLELYMYALRCLSYTCIPCVAGVIHACLALLELYMYALRCLSYTCMMY